MDINFDTQRDPSHPYLHAVHDFTHMQQRYINEPQMWVKWIWYVFMIEFAVIVS